MARKRTQPSSHLLGHRTNSLRLRALGVLPGACSERGGGKTLSNNMKWVRELKYPEKDSNFRFADLDFGFWTSKIRRKDKSPQSIGGNSKSYPIKAPCTLYQHMFYSRHSGSGRTFLFPGYGSGRAFGRFKLPSDSGQPSPILAVVTPRRGVHGGCGGLG
jgi:hypothetical protein